MPLLHLPVCVAYYSLFLFLSLHLDKILIAFTLDVVRTTSQEDGFCGYFLVQFFEILCLKHVLSSKISSYLQILGCKQR